MTRVESLQWRIAAVCICFLNGVDQAVGAPQETASPSTAESAFSARASAVPFPPDAREVEFDATFDDIEFTTRSSLASLVHFYRHEMPKRGWQEDESAAMFDEEDVELAFTHGDARVDIEMDLGSDKEVDVTMDCEELDFSGADDPAALLAAGVPQPRAYVYLQQQIRLPEQIRDLQYARDECSFKSQMQLQPAFDHFSNMIKKLEFRESRRPIITDDRRYTEFQRGPIELSLNIFSHDYGTRLHIGYENSQQEPRVAPLPPGPAPTIGGESVANAAGGASAADAEMREVEIVTPTGTPIDVSNNKGQVVVTFGQETYTFRHVAAYQSKYFGDERTFLVFSGRPIPLKQMQTMIVENEDFSFGDLFEFDLPDFISIQLGEYPGFSFTVPGVGIGRGMEHPEIELKIEQGRAQAKVKMAPEEIFDKPFSFEATADAAVMTPTTRVANFTDPPAAPAPGSSIREAQLPLPEGAANAYNSGTAYRRETHASVDMPLDEVAAFYRGEFTAPEWQEDADAGGRQVGDDGAVTSDTLVFRGRERSMVVNLKPGGAGTTIDVASREDAKARRDGLLPESGKSRLIMGNAHTKTVVISIGKQNYTLRPGRGADDPKTALNYTVTPGTYTLLIKIPGEQPQEEKVPIRPGQTWGVIALPTGGAMTMQLY